MSDCLWPHELYSPWNSPGQNTGVGSLSLLQGIFPTQGSNPGLPHCRHSLYQLSQKGSPRILEWVAYPFSRGSSWPRNQTGVSRIAGGFFTNWAIREAPGKYNKGFFYASQDTKFLRNHLSNISHCPPNRYPTLYSDVHALAEFASLKSTLYAVMHMFFLLLLTSLVKLQVREIFPQADTTYFILFKRSNLFLLNLAILFPDSHELTPPI